MYSSQLSNFSSFTLNFILHVIKLFSQSNPQRLVRQHLDGEYVPIFPLGFVGFRIGRRHKNVLAREVMT